MTPILHLLADVRRSLDDGDYETLTSISAMLETVLVPTDPRTLHLAARMARDNARSLQAAANGIRAAQRRIAELRNARRLTVYDASGQRHQTTTPPDRAHRL